MTLSLGFAYVELARYAEVVIKPTQSRAETVAVCWRHHGAALQ